MSLAGNPAGGTLTSGQGGALNLGEPTPGQVGVTAQVTIDTNATDTIANVVTRLNEAINQPAGPFRRSLVSSVDPGDSSALILGGWPSLNSLPFLVTTDTGLDVQPGVTGFSAVYDKANDEAQLTWSIPTSATYDSVRIARNMEVLSDLAGSATSYADVNPELPEDALLDGFLQYQIVGITNDRPSGMATVVVQKPVWIIPIALPDGQVGVSYNATIDVTGGIALPITWSIPPGELPAGLSLDSSSGAVSGTPTQAGDYVLGVIAQDSRTPEPTSHYKIIDLKINE